MKTYAKILIYLALPILFALSCKKDRIDDHWERVYSSPGQYDLMDMDFFDRETGVIIANSYVDIENFTQLLIYTTDGGLTWEETPFRLPDLDPVISVEMLDGRSVIGATALGNVVETTDWGQSWVPKVQSKIPTMRSVLFPYSASEGFGLGVGYIFKTTDGGTTWKTTLNEPGTEPKSLIFPSGNSIGYASGGYANDFVDYGTLLKTTDGGETWAAIDNKFKMIIAASFVSNNTGYLFTNDRKLWATKNGGNSWKNMENNLKLTHRIEASYFVSEHRGYLVEKGNGIWGTADAGRTWVIAQPVYRSYIGGTGNSRFSKVGNALYTMINGYVYVLHF